MTDPTTTTPVRRRVHHGGEGEKGNPFSYGGQTQGATGQGEEADGVSQVGALTFGAGSESAAMGKGPQKK